VLSPLLHVFSEWASQACILILHFLMVDSHFFIILHESLKSFFQSHASTHDFNQLVGLFVGYLCLDRGCVSAMVLGQGETLALTPNIMYPNYLDTHTHKQMREEPR